MWRIGFAVFIFMFFSITLQIASSQSLDDLTIMTEQYPPYNFQTGKRLSGISVDTLVLMLQRSGSSLKRGDIKILPWARGYNTTLRQPKTCLFSTTRTKERENLFKWVGPVGTNKIVLTAVKSRKIRIDSVQDLKRYQIGVIQDDIADQMLIKMGIGESSIQRVADTIHNIRKLNAGRIDLWGYGENVARWELKTNGFDIDAYETVYVLNIRELYFAFHKDTSHKIITRLQQALDQIKHSGEYEKILDAYLQ